MQESGQRLVRLALVAVLVPAVLAMHDGPVVDTAVLATDPCEDGPSSDEPSLDVHDICDVTVEVTTGEDVAPSISVSLRTAADQVRGTNYIVTLDVGACGLQLRHDRDALADIALLRFDGNAILGCGDHDVRCASGVSNAPVVGDVHSLCYRRYEDAVGVTATVRHDGDVVTYELDGAQLPELGQVLVPGTVVAVDHALVAPDWAVLLTYDGDPTYFYTCDEPESCFHPGADRAFGTGSMTLRDDA